MSKIIKLTKNQLLEADNEAFIFLDGADDTKPFNGQSEISAQGYLNPQKYGKPLTTDKVSKQLYRGSNGRYGIIAAMPFWGGFGCCCEGVQGDQNNNKIDDFYENTSNTNVNIPQSIVSAVSNLSSKMKTYTLSPKQIAFIISQLIEKNPILSNNSEMVKSLLRQKIDPTNIKDFD